MARTLVFNGYGFQRKQNFLSEIWVSINTLKTGMHPLPSSSPNPSQSVSCSPPSLFSFPHPHHHNTLRTGRIEKKLQCNDPLFIYSLTFFCSCLSPVERYQTNPADLNERQPQFMAGGLIRDQHKCTIDTIVACWQSPFQRVLFTPKPWPLFSIICFRSRQGMDEVEQNAKADERIW